MITILILQSVLHRDAENHGDSFEGVTKRKGAIAAVGGNISLSNFGMRASHWARWDSILFSLSNVVLVGYQYYDYGWRSVFGRRVEDAYDCVTLPRTFVMYRYIHCRIP